MRTWWAWASVLALCLSPALAQARGRGHDRRDDGGRHASARRHFERRESQARNREGSRHEARRLRHSADRPASSARRRPDAGRDGGRHPRSSDRWDRRNSRDSARGWNSRDERRGWHRDRRSHSPRRGSYRSAPRRGWPSFRVRPLRYPSHYRYGYFHRHGYYFPRYYYDYDNYATHAAIRILVEPEETEVYVDGYYAGVADDFDGIFQRLYLTPGGHEIALRLDGYRTWRADVFAAPDRTLKLHHDMLPGPSGSEFDYSSAYEEP